jgi:hypothetical protein
VLLQLLITKYSTIFSVDSVVPLTEVEFIMKNNILLVLKALISIVFLFSLFTTAYCGVIFEDNFDDQPDWQSQQTVHKSVGGSDIAFAATYFETCSTYCPPGGWTSYRAPSSQWTDDRRRDTFIIDSTAARGGSGKGVTYNIESTNDYGEWSGGSLDLWLGADGYDELYIGMWIKFTDEWLYSTTERGEHGLEKLMRISTFNDDIATTTENPQAFGGSYINYPVWYPDWYYNVSYDKAYFTSATRSAPNYGNADQAYSSVLFPSNSSNAAQGDDQWHHYEFRVKMNSANGVADGEYQFWLDGVSQLSESDIMWKESGSNTTGWNWLMFMDNVSVSPYAEDEYKEMSIYMDDVVVSTDYIGTAYVISESDSAVSIQPPPNVGIITSE